MPNKKNSEQKDVTYLYEMYNATSTYDGKGELETYEAWTERQLLLRINAQSTEDKEMIKGAEEFLESKGIKDTLYDPMSPQTNYWMKKGLSKLLIEFYRQANKCVVIDSVEFALFVIEKYYRKWGDDLWRTHDDDENPLTDQQLYDLFTKSKVTTDKI